MAQDCDWGLLYGNMLQVALKGMEFLEQLWYRYFLKIFVT